MLFADACDCWTTGVLVPPVSISPSIDLDFTHGGALGPDRTEGEDEVLLPCFLLDCESVLIGPEVCDCALSGLENWFASLSSAVLGFIQEEALLLDPTDRGEARSLTDRVSETEDCWLEGLKLSFAPQWDEAALAADAVERGDARLLMWFL
jgi:hypothetical protein